MKKTQFNACNPFNLKLLYTHTHCIDSQSKDNLRKGNAMNTSPIARLQALRTSVTNKSVSSTAISNVVQLPLPFEGYPGEGKGGTSKGWNYLLADSVSFSKEVDHAIRIQKPEKEKMPEWISKLITGGQCKTLYVENIDLDLQPTDSDMIRKLCKLYSVCLVNVRVDSALNEGNLAVGPW